MIQPTPQVEQFKQYLRDSLRRERLNARTIKIAKHAHVYANGDLDDAIYFIDSEQRLRKSLLQLAQKLVK